MEIREILEELVESFGIDAIQTKEEAIAQAEESIEKTRLTEEEIAKVLLNYVFNYYDEEGHNIEETVRLEDFTTKSHINDLAHAIYEAGRKKG